LDLLARLDPELIPHPAARVPQEDPSRGLDQPSRQLSPQARRGLLQDHHQHVPAPPRCRVGSARSASPGGTLGGTPPAPSAGAPPPPSPLPGTPPGRSYRSCTSRPRRTRTTVASRCG